MRQQPRLLFGTSAAITKALEQAARFARGRRPVVLLGETGTGKTVMAERIHQLSGRCGSFVSVPASQLVPNLELGELRGHVRGAFTGAVQDQAGLLETAHGGTLFLDELGDASPTIQLILLQAIEDGTVRRVGESRPRPVDVRFIFATHARLEDLVEEGRFRRDLYHRLGYFKILMPPLAERRDEIALHVEAFLEQEAKVLGLAGPPPLTPELRACLQAAPWPGNIRDLANLCAYLACHSDLDRPIDVCDLPPDFVAPLGAAFRRRHDASSRARRASKALERTGGNVTAAARLLGVSRTHFYRVLKAEA